MQEVLGVDIGGVIIDRVNDRKDTSFFRDRYLEATAVAGAFDAIARLNRGRFGGQIFLVSKCGEKVEARTREWLSHHGFYKKVGIPEYHVIFCRERSHEAQICSGLGVTHFVDDKLEVLGYLGNVAHRYLFDPVEREVQEFAHHLPYVQRVESWSDIIAELLQ